MTRQNTKFLCAVASIIVIGVLFSSCGRRGNLESPDSTTEIITDEHGNKITKPLPKRDKPFILDGLI